MKDVGVQKVPGYIVGLRYKTRFIRSQLGIVPIQRKRTKLVLHDMEEEEKERMFKYHSEKLIVAFGILTNLCHEKLARV